MKQDCRDCIRFISCESGKQYFHTMTGDPCKEFKCEEPTMTKQEAIECLREMMDRPFPLTLAKIEALKMGVEALEKQIRSDTE